MTTTRYVVVQGDRYLTCYVEPECRWTRRKHHAWVFATEAEASIQATKHNGKVLVLRFPKKPALDLELLTGLATFFRTGSSDALAIYCFKKTANLIKKKPTTKIPDTEDYSPTAHVTRDDIKRAHDELRNTSQTCDELESKRGPCAKD